MPECKLAEKQCHIGVHQKLFLAQKLVLKLDQRQTFSLGCSRQHYGRDGAFKPCKLPYSPLNFGRAQTIQGRPKQALLTGVLGGVRLLLGKRLWKEP